MWRALNPGAGGERAHLRTARVPISMPVRMQMRNGGQWTLGTGGLTVPPVLLAAVAEWAAAQLRARHTDSVAGVGRTAD